MWDVDRSICTRKCLRLIDTFLLTLPSSFCDHVNVFFIFGKHLDMCFSERFLHFDAFIFPFRNLHFYYKKPAAETARASMRARTDRLEDADLATWPSFIWWERRRDFCLCNFQMSGRLFKRHTILPDHANLPTWPSKKRQDQCGPVIPVDPCDLCDPGDPCDSCAFFLWPSGQIRAPVDLLNKSKLMCWYDSSAPFRWRAQTLFSKRKTR